MTVLSQSAVVVSCIYTSALLFADSYAPFRVLVKVLILFSIFISVFEKNFKSSIHTRTHLCIQDKLCKITKLLML